MPLGTGQIRNTAQKRKHIVLNINEKSAKQKGTQNMDKIIAVDFDGTIVGDKYPEIGPEIFAASATIRYLQQ